MNGFPPRGRCCRFAANQNGAIGFRHALGRTTYRAHLNRAGGTKMHRFLGLLIVSLVLSACAVSRDAAKVDFEENPSDAFLLIKVTAVSADYSEAFAPYREATSTLEQNPKKQLRFGVGRTGRAGAAGPERYLAIRVDPGTYVFTQFTQDAFWSLCFQARAKSFSVKAGDAVFLGDLDPTIHLVQVEQIARARGETQSRDLQSYTYSDRIIPLQITSPMDGSQDFAAAKTFEAQSMPTLRGRLKPVVYRDVHFATEQDSCGYGITMKPERTNVLDE
jgi:hypothetical protein